MKSKAIVGVMLTLFLVSMLTMAFDVNAQSAQWTQVNVDGFGDPNNIICADMGVFDGYLYAGTANSVTGGEIWRSSDGTTWTQVNTDGFGDPNNFKSVIHVIFEDCLYVGTGNYATGVEIWRLSPPAVGGIYIPINKLELLAPYIGLTMLLAATVVTLVYVKKRKRHTEINS